jgi:hypothetical protein
MLLLRSSNQFLISQQDVQNCTTNQHGYEEYIQVQLIVEYMCDIQDNWKKHAE